MTWRTSAGLSDLPEALHWELPEPYVSEIVSQKSLVQHAPALRFEVKPWPSLPDLVKQHISEASIATKGKEQFVQPLAPLNPVCTPTCM